MSYPAFNAPPGVYRRTVSRGEVDVWCHKPECPDFNMPRVTSLMYEEDTGGYYVEDLECPECNHDREEHYARWTGQCTNPRCIMYLDDQVVDDALALDEAECVDCATPLQFKEIP